jgi:hypothetical protein
MVDKGRRPTAILKTNEIGGAFILKRVIQSLIRRENLADVQVSLDKERREVAVFGNITQEQLEGQLGSVRIPYELAYHGLCAQVAHTEKSSAHYPDDYGILKGKVHQLQAQVGDEQARSLRLQSDLDGERKRSAGLEQEIAVAKRKYRDLEVRCAQPANVQDFLADMMTRENRLWESFISSYSETLQLGADILKIASADLEAEIIQNANPEDSEEFVELERKYREAVRARELVSKNPYVKIDEGALAIILKFETLRQRQSQLDEVRSNLLQSVAATRLRLAISSSGNETLITLPFKYRPKEREDYHIFENGLVQGIKSFLGSRNLAFGEEAFNNLLRYTVPGMTTRPRNALPKAIYSLDDAFTKLGGKREVVRVEIL